MASLPLGLTVEIERLTAPDFATGILTYEFKKVDESQRPMLHVVGIDLDAAREDPDFRLRLQQLLYAFSDMYESERLNRAVDQRVLAMLKEEGLEPSGNWLWDNLEELRAAVAAAESASETVDGK